MFQQEIPDNILIRLYLMDNLLNLQKMNQIYETLIV